MGTETTYVAGSRWFDIEVVPTDVLQASVTITLDGEREWTFREPAWRPINVGCGAESDFLWSARELIRLPRDLDEGPDVVARTDEDLIMVFEHEQGLMLVCETSIRRIVGNEETDSWGLPDVVTGIVWRGADLVVRSWSGDEAVIRVAGPSLIPAGG